MESLLLSTFKHFVAINMTLIACNFVFDSIVIVCIVITITIDKKSLFDFLLTV